MRGPLLLAGIWMCLCPCHVRAATFTVVTNADDGPGSLRQALLDSNASPEADLIRFAMQMGLLTQETPLGEPDSPAR